MVCAKEIKPKAKKDTEFKFSYGVCVCKMKLRGWENYCPYCGVKLVWGDNAKDSTGKEAN